MNSFESADIFHIKAFYKTITLTFHTCNGLSSEADNDFYSRARPNCYKTSPNKGDVLLILRGNACSKKSVAPQQNKTKWEAFHVSAASVYNGVYAMTENIIVMLVAAEVMAPASVCGGWLPFCVRQPLLSSSPKKPPTPRQKERPGRMRRGRAEEEDEEEERRNPSERTTVQVRRSRKSAL